MKDEALAFNFEDCSKETDEVLAFNFEDGSKETDEVLGFNDESSCTISLRTLLLFLFTSILSLLTGMPESSFLASSIDSGLTSRVTEIFFAVPVHSFLSILRDGFRVSVFVDLIALVFGTLPSQISNSLLFLELENFPSVPDKCLSTKIFFKVVAEKEVHALLNVPDKLLTFKAPLATILNEMDFDRLFLQIPLSFVF